MTVIAALLLGWVATSAQALRWRTLAAQRGIPLGFRRALADCYASSFANMVLPGGLGGDAARVAVYRNHGSRRLLSSLTALGAERLSATSILFTLTATALWPRSTPLAIGALVVAVMCLAVTIRCMGGLGRRAALLVWSTSALGVMALVTLYLVAMSALGGPVVPSLALVGLASMSIPLGVGGWGVRELSVGTLASTLAVNGDLAVASATAYGLLATISCLPGAVVVAAVGWRTRRSPAHGRTTCSRPVVGAERLRDHPS